MIREESQYGEIIVYSAFLGEYGPNPKHTSFTGYNHFTDPCRNAKIYKVLPHLFLPEHTWSVWVDSTIVLTRPVEELVARVKKDVAVFKHRDRDCVYSEARAAKDRDDPWIIDEQVQYYRSIGYPAHAGLGMCGIVIRKNTPEVARLNEQWWAHICRLSKRDQISFPVVFGDAVQYLPRADHVQGNEFFRVVV